jgi:hypothetical protein
MYDGSLFNSLFYSHGPTAGPYPEPVELIP